MAASSIKPVITACVDLDQLIIDYCIRDDFRMVGNLAIVSKDMNKLVQQLVQSIWLELQCPFAKDQLSLTKRVETWIKLQTATWKDKQEGFQMGGIESTLPADLQQLKEEDLRNIFTLKKYLEFDEAFSAIEWCFYNISTERCPTQPIDLFDSTEKVIEFGKKCKEINEAD